MNDIICQKVALETTLGTEGCVKYEWHEGECMTMSQFIITVNHRLLRMGCEFHSPTMISLLYARHIFRKKEAMNSA